MECTLGCGKAKSRGPPPSTRGDGSLGTECPISACGTPEEESPIWIPSSTVCQALETRGNNRGRGGDRGAALVHP